VVQELNRLRTESSPVLESCMNTIGKQQLKQATLSLEINWLTDKIDYNEASTHFSSIDDGSRRTMKVSSTGRKAHCSHI